MWLDKNKILYILLYLSLAHAVSYAPNVATSAGNWLNLDTSIRSLGMGRAQVATGFDVSSVSDNPAHASLISGSQLYTSQTKYIAGIEYISLAYGFQSTSNDYIVFSLFSMDSGEMKETNIVFPDGTGAYFNVSSILLRFTYGRKFSDQLSIGVSGKYLKEGIADSDLASMSGLAMDIGSTYKLQRYGIVLGAALANLGPSVQFKGDGLEISVPDTLETGGFLSKITKQFSLPLTLKLGASKNFQINQNNSISLACDMNKSSDYSILFNIGTEYTFKKRLYVRLGTVLGHDTAFYSTGLGWSIGKIQIDYGLSNHGIFDFTHQFSLRLGF